MEQDIETSREGSAAPLAGNVSVEPHADDSDDSLWKYAGRLPWKRDGALPPSLSVIQIIFRQSRFA